MIEIYEKARNCRGHTKPMIGGRINRFFDRHFQSWNFGRSLKRSGERERVQAYNWRAKLGYGPFPIHVLCTQHPNPMATLQTVMAAVQHTQEVTLVQSTFILRGWRERERRRENVKGAVSASDRGERLNRKRARLARWRNNNAFTAEIKISGEKWKGMIFDWIPFV